MIQIHQHGSAGPWVIALHGGPAAAGSAAPIAHGLADSFRVLEPWQRGSGDEPLTVARHVADLHEVVASCCGGSRPAIVGESWGAMLALAYAAGHPESAGPLALIGCGTFDKTSRARLQATLDQRTTDDVRKRVQEIEEATADPGERMRRQHAVREGLYEYDAIRPEERTRHEPEPPPFDVQAHTETWEDMLRLQEAGVYPDAFAAIRSPVIMLHGAYDPHPGRMIRDSLLPHLPQLEYREWERCGHSPWYERHVREEFFSVLENWFLRHASGGVTV
jgi:pimeloyl-ACP methyl ester carboxylesterase